VVGVEWKKKARMKFMRQMKEITARSMMKLKKRFNALLCTFLIFLLLVPTVFAEKPEDLPATVPPALWEKIKSSDINIEFYGTEYAAGDPATVWLQLLRNYQPINDAACYATAYYPDKTLLLDNILMSYLAGSDGIYYYDLTAPSTTGVYMLSAVCLVPRNVFADDFLDYSNLESYENITIADGKIILYPYVGAWTAIDSSGNNRNGTLANMESSDWVVGKLNGALRFDGIDEYVDLEDIANFDKEQSFSVEAWIKTTSNKTQNIISRRDAQPNIERGWEFQISNGKLKFTVSRAITNTYWVSQESLQSINDGNWHHVIATWTGVTGTWGYPSNIKLYIDGQLADSYPSGNVVGWSIMNDAHCQISGKVFDKYNVFGGVIDEVVIYTKTLSLSEVQFRYNNGTGTETMLEDVYPYGWWHLNPTIGATSGYIRSEPISLEGIRWNDFNSDYDNKEGNIQFKVLDSSNNEICSSLGDISSCAGTTTPVKFYAQLTKPNNTSASPEIERWYVSWLNKEAEEIRGSGEMHVVGVSDVSMDVWKRFLMLGTPPLMSSTEYYCKDDITLVKNMTFEFCEDTKCSVISKTEDIFCNYGCDTELNECKKAPYQNAMIIFGAVVGFIILMLIILRLMGRL
jgi:hypothetical protein